MLTFYDDATEERVDLTAADLGGWAARVEALLREGCGLGVGSRAAILLPPHWQTAAVLIASWAAGVAVSFRLWATAGLAGPADGPLDATFVAHNRLGSWLEDIPFARHEFVLGLAPGGAPLAEVPVGYKDLMAELTRYPSGELPVTLTRPWDPATVDGTSYREWAAVARGIAAAQGLAPRDRVLVDAAEYEHPMTWLLAPLSIGASVVLCANLDRTRLDARIEVERVTRVL